MRLKLKNLYLWCKQNKINLQTKQMPGNKGKVYFKFTVDHHKRVYCIGTNKQNWKTEVNRSLSAIFSSLHMVPIDITNE